MCTNHRIPEINSLICPLSLQTAIREAVPLLEAAGVEYPRLEAELLLAHLFRLDRLELYLRWDQMLSEVQVHQFHTLLTRRLGREPMAYIIGRKEFWSLEFLVKPGVLIPRPETEFVVEAAIKYLPAQGKIVEVGTGSGAIAICLAKELTQVELLATDISETALQIARANARLHLVNERLFFLKADLLNPFGPQTVEAIISNPPYIPSDEIPLLAPEISIFEPRLALDGGQDGLLYYRQLIKQARTVLKKKGWLILEIGFAQRDLVIDECQKQGYYIKEVIADYSNLDRVIIAQMVDW